MKLHRHLDMPHKTWLESVRRDSHELWASWILGALCWKHLETKDPGTIWNHLEPLVAFDL